MSIFETGILCLLIVAIYLLQAILNMLKVMQKEQLDNLERIVEIGDLSNTRVELEKLEKDYKEGTIEEKDHRMMKPILESIIERKKGPSRPYKSTW